MELLSHEYHSRSSAIAVASRAMSSSRLARLLSAAFGLVVILALAGCGSGPMKGSPEALQSALETPYTLGAGDKLHIVVFGEDSLSGDYSVS
jgi:polysaccharide export outer membrane protein